MRRRSEVRPGASASAGSPRGVSWAGRSHECRAVVESACADATSSEGRTPTPLRESPCLVRAVGRFGSESRDHACARADDLPASSRCGAACAAVLDDRGQGVDASEVGENERAPWRERVRHGLGADLAACREWLHSGGRERGVPVESKLVRRKRTPARAGLRESRVLDGLPASEHVRRFPRPCGTPDVARCARAASLRTSSGYFRKRFAIQRSIVSNATGANVSWIETNLLSAPLSHGWNMWLSPLSSTIS